MNTSPEPLPAADLARLYADLSSGRAHQIRRTARLAQVDIARAIGASRSAVASWENGRRRPRGAMAVRYASILRSLVELRHSEVPGAGK